MVRSEDYTRTYYERERKKQLCEGCHIQTDQMYEHDEEIEMYVHHWANHALLEI